VNAGHHTQVVTRNGQHAQFLVSNKGIGINDSQTNIRQVNSVQLVQSVEGLGVQVLQGAVGDLDGSHVLKTQILEEVGSHQDGVLRTHIGHNQIRNVRAKLLDAHVKSAAGGHQIAVDIPGTLTESWTGHVLAKDNLLIIGQKVVSGIVLVIIIIQTLVVVILRVAVDIVSTLFGLLVVGFAL